MIANIANDVGAWITCAALAGGSIGFMTCALLVSGQIRRQREEDFQAGYECCNRDHHNARTNPLRNQ